MKTTIKQVIVTMQNEINSKIAEANGFSLLGYLSRNDYPEHITGTRVNLYGSACLYKFSGGLNF